MTEQVPQQSLPALFKQLSGVYQENFLQTLLPDLVVNFEDINDLNIKNRAVLEALEAMQPKDAHELMLCIQILALHRQGMNFMYKLAHADGKFMDRYLNASAKLLRLHGEKLEALNRYRRKGHQVVQVEHVHVHQGAQAVIGNIQTGGGEDEI
jgi:hypothetical protein